MTSYSGVTWRVNYGEISEREQFRVGRLSLESYDAYFLLSELTDLIDTLTAVTPLDLNVIVRGSKVQAVKVSDGLLTSVVISPRLDTGTPVESMRLPLSELTDLLYALSLFRADTSALPDDWDFSKPNPINEAALPKYLQQTELSATFAEVTSIRQFVQTGEVLGGVTDGNNSAIFQRAIDALNAAYVADGKLRIIYVPDGTYYLGTTLIWKSGVGMRGASQEGTVLYAPAGVGNGSRGSAIWSAAGPTTQILDTHFETFTIDGIRQAPAGYRTQYKGLEFEYAKRCRLKHVTVRNTAATAMAFDAPVDVILDHPVMVNFGRQIGVLGLDPEQTSGCSGLGNGVGEYDIESITVISPWIDGGASGLNGIFFERPTYDAIANGGHQGRGIVINGAIVFNCYVGYRESGAIGAMVEGNFFDNRINGVRIDSTNLTYRGGEETLFRGVVKRNGNPAYARSAGVWVGAGGDRCIIDGDVSENVGPGIATAPAALMGGSKLGPGVQVRANVHHNKGPGVVVQSPGTGPSGEVVGFSVLGDVYCNGTDPAAPVRAGVLVKVSTDRLTLKGWIGDDTATPTQQIGVALLGAAEAASRINVSADLSGNVTPLAIEQYVYGNLKPIGTDLTKVSNLRVVETETATGGKVTLAWTAPLQFVGTAITNYSIRYRKVGDVTWVPFAHSSSTATNIQVTGLDSRVPYEFQVAAVIDAGTPAAGDYTEPVVASAEVLPVYSDTFQRATALNTPGSTDGGTAASTAWQVMNVTGTTNNWGIHTNPSAPPVVGIRPEPTSPTNAGGSSLLHIDTTTAGGVHKVSLGSLLRPSYLSVGLAFRIQDSTHYWLLCPRRYPDAGNGYALHLFNGSTTPTVALNLNTYTPTEGDVLEVRDKGTSIECWVNGVLLGTYTGGSVGLFSGATKAGLGGNYRQDYRTTFHHWSYAAV